MLSADGEASTDGGDMRSPEEGAQRARDSGSASAGAMAAAAVTVAAAAAAVAVGSDDVPLIKRPAASKATASRPAPRRQGGQGSAAAQPSMRSRDIAEYTKWLRCTICGVRSRVGCRRSVECIGRPAGRGSDMGLAKGNVLRHCMMLKFLDCEAARPLGAKALLLERPKEAYKTRGGPMRPAPIRMRPPRPAGLEGRSRKAAASRGQRLKRPWRPPPSSVFRLLDLPLRALRLRAPDKSWNLSIVLRHIH